MPDENMQYENESGHEQQNVDVSNNQHNHSHPSENLQNVHQSIRDSQVIMSSKHCPICGGNMKGDDRTGYVCLDCFLIFDKNNVDKLA